MQWRQGDVLIESVSEIDPSFEPTKETLLVRGEGRYHGHYIDGEVAIYESPDLNPEEPISHYLEVSETAALKHLHTVSHQETGEHKTLIVPPGRYRIIRQREYDPYAKVIAIIKD